MPGDFLVSKLSSRDRTPDSLMDKLVRDGVEVWGSLISVLLSLSTVNTDLKYQLKQSTMIIQLLCQVLHVDCCT